MTQTVVLDEIYNELTAHILQIAPEIARFRVDLEVPSGTDAQMYPTGGRVEYGNHGEDLHRRVNVTVGLALVVDQTVSDQPQLVQAANIAHRIADGINWYSRCGRLARAVSNIDYDILPVDNTQEDPDDFYIYVFLRFEAYYQDDRQIRVVRPTA